MEGLDWESSMLNIQPLLWRILSTMSHLLAWHLKYDICAEADLSSDHSILRETINIHKEDDEGYRVLTRAQVKIRLQASNFGIADAKGTSQLYQYH